MVSSDAQRRFVRAAVLAVHEHGDGARREKVLELDVVSDTNAPLDAPPASLYYRADAQRDPPQESIAVLRDQWASSPVQVGHTVHLVGVWAPQPYRRPPPPQPPADDDELWAGLDEAVFDEGELDIRPTLVLSTFGRGSPENDHWLVLHPDTILSASSLASVASCMRRPMLQERVKTAADTTLAAVMGNMVHGLLQACLVAQGAPLEPAHDTPYAIAAPLTWARLGDFTRPFFHAEIERQLQENRASLSVVGSDTHTARAALVETVPRLVAFGERYLALRAARHEEAQSVDDARAAHPARVRITKVLGTEVEIVSPMYGLKGRLDVVVEVQVHQGTAPPRTCVVPLEIKTGRLVSSTEHAAQTTLYTLLLSDHAGAAVDEGLLLYTQTTHVKRIPASARDFQSLLLARNEMAQYRAQLPPIALEAEEASDDEFGAGLPAAALALAEPPILPPTIDKAYQCTRCYARNACMLYRAAVEHVDDRTSEIAALYAAHTAELHADDRAFFQHWDALLSHEESGLTRYRTELWTRSAADRAALGRCRTGARYVPETAATWVWEHAHSPTTLAVDDRVLLSTDEPHPAYLGRGRVEAVDSAGIRLRMENDWGRAWEQERARTHTTTFTFRIDVDELSSMMSVPRYNIACLFYPDATARTRALRARVVHAAVPTWSALSPAFAALAAKHTQHANADQRHAIERALGANDYTLILGMPGTGKSTTLATLITILVAAGQRVLLSSYTHSAVDTVLAKLAPTMDVLRIGAPSRVDPRVRHWTLDERLGPHADVAALHTLATSSAIVAATCLATNDAVFAHASFDVCILDEASQITVPTCLGPLRYADRFVLLGDHQQLAPLVRDEHAARGGLGTSLFQQLCAAHPAAVVAMGCQYRMNAAIMALSNTLVYDGRLRCGNAHVAQAQLDVHMDHVEGWLRDVLDPARPVLFVDTDALPAPEVRTGDQVANPREAQILATLCRAFVQGGVEARAIGVLTPYRAQLRRLAAECAHISPLTVDQAQGRDWSLVLVSLVRSHPHGTAGALLRDVRRLNVLLTRAQHKLVLVGSARTMRGGDDDQQRPMPRLMALLEHAHAVVPVGALDTAAAVATKTSPSKARALKSARVPPLTNELLHEAGWH